MLDAQPRGIHCPSCSPSSHCFIRSSLGHVVGLALENVVEKVVYYTASDEIKDHEVQEHVAQHVVEEGRFVGDVFELRVAGIDLHSEANGEDEEPRAGKDPCQEGVERKRSHDHHVQELHDCGSEARQKKGIDDLFPRRGV
eukprot:scaffold281_cov318-Pavlova_lutheri.AAC.25